MRARPTDIAEDRRGQSRLISIGVRWAPRCTMSDGRVIDLEPKDALLLAYLAVEGPTPRGRLATLLWPDVDDERARGNLRQRLLRLKRSTGVELVAGNPQAALAAGIGHDLDDGHELLHGIEPHQAGGLADWLEAQRERRLRARIEGLDAATTQAENEGDLAAALRHASALVDLDPLSEHAHRRVMRVHYLRGDPAAAAAAYERCRDTLRRELNAAPSKETEALRASVAGAAVPATGASAARAVPLSVLRPPRLIGRDAEWAALESAWNAGHTAVVLGEAGLGKTRLVTDLARSQGGAVLVSARPGDERVVYAVTTRLLRQLPRDTLAALDGSVRKELARLLPECGDAEPIRSDTERSRFFNAVAAALDASRTAVRGVVIDDLHFADDASLELVQYLAADSPLRWIFTTRPAEIGPQGRALLNAMRAGPSCAWIELAPLTLPQMVDLIASLGIEELDPAEMAPALMRHTGGNPMFALETIKVLLAQRSAAGPTRLPVVANLGALIDRRIGKLSPGAIRLARCAAVAGQDFSAELAAHVLGVRPLDLADAWSELEAAQVLRDGAFAHDLIYEAALASVPPPIARPLHRELAEYLSRHDGEPARIAAHRLAAGEQSLAIDALQAAARRCIDAGRIIEGGRHFRNAADIAAAAGEPAGRVFDLYYSAASALWLTASTAEFNELIGPLQQWARTDKELALCWMAEGHRAERAGALEQYAAANERALDLCTRAGEQSLVAVCRMSLGHLCVFRGQHEKALHHLAAAADVFRELGYRHDEAAARSNLGAVLSTLCRFDEANRQLELAVPGLVEGKYYAYLIANYNTRVKNALIRGDARRAVDLAGQARSFGVSGEAEAGTRAVTPQRQIEALRRLGRFREALEVYAAARSEFETETHPDCRCIGLHAVPLFLDLGRADRAAALLSEFERQDNVNRVDAELAKLLRLRTAGSGAMALELARAADLAQLSSPTQRCAFAIELARKLDGSGALALIERETRQAEELGLGAYLASLWLARAELVHAQRDKSLALAACDAANEAIANFDADAYRPALLMRLHRLEAALGRPDRAAACLREATVWIRRAEDLHVPAEFRESFLNRNPVNREVVTLATRQA
jgi:DNA-binding SARP family transcriptional activator